LSVGLPANLPQDGFPTFKGQDWSEHVETARALIESLEGHRWALAAVCASVDVKYGEESFAQFASEIAWSTRSVYAYAQTYRAFESRNRSQILSFHHHTIAARAEDPEEAIEMAEVEELSTRELERRLQGREAEEMEKCPTCDGRGRVPATLVSPQTTD
jgi:hypothetical protein